MGQFPAEIRVYPDPDSLARAGVDFFVTLAREALAIRKRFSVALAGGSTPRRMYATLAGNSRAAELDWPGIHVFWSDERCVPPEHPDSNYRLARESLLDRLPIPAVNVHRLPGELEPKPAAAAYDQLLRSFFTGPANAARQTFDLVLLGLGRDGHTASLFPGSPALDEQERWVAAVEHHTPPPPLVDRLTLTLPAINAASQVVFLVSGADKTAIVRQVLAVTSAEPPLPAQLVRPTRGRLTWLLDADAAGNF